MCLIVVVNDFVTILRVAFLTPVPVAVMILNSLRYMVVHTTVPTHCIANVNFLLLGFLVKSQKRFFGSLMVWIESFLKGCLWGFDLFIRAIDYHFSLAANSGMMLKIANFC